MNLIQSKAFDNWFSQTENKPVLSFFVKDDQQVKAVYNETGKCEIKYFKTVKEAKTWLEFKEFCDTRSDSLK